MRNLINCAVDIKDIIILVNHYKMVVCQWKGDPENLPALIEAEDSLDYWQDVQTSWYVQFENYV